jgi:hypothetical protein
MVDEPEIPAESRGAGPWPFFCPIAGVFVALVCARLRALRPLFWIMSPLLGPHPQSEHGAPLGHQNSGDACPRASC